VTDLTERERVSPIEPPDPPTTLSTDDQIVPMWRQRLRIFFHNKLAVASVVFLFLTIAACFLVPVLHPTNQTNQAATFACPGTPHPPWHHWLGTDSSGFDELGRIFYGGEYSLTLGFVAGFITIVVGTTYGMISGFAGGITDTLMMRLIDAFLSIPYIFLLITLIAIFIDQRLSHLHHRLHPVVGNARIIRGDALLIRNSNTPKRPHRHGRAQVAHHPPSRLPELDQQHRDRGDVLGRRRDPLPLGPGLPGTGYPGAADRLGHDAPGRHVTDPERLLVGDLPLALVFILVVVSINYIGDALRDCFEVRLLER